MTKILVIEDEEQIRQEVIGAANGYLGLDCLKYAPLSAAAARRRFLNLCTD